MPQVTGVPVVALSVLFIHIVTSKECRKELTEIQHFWWFPNRKKLCVLVTGFIELLQNVTTSNYCTIANSHTHYSSLQQAPSLLSLLYLHRLSPSNGFQRRGFLSFRVHVLTGRQLSHNWLNAVGRWLNCYWSSPAQSFLLRTPRDPWPRFLLSPRYVCVSKWGLLFDERVVGLSV
jgi:hypothetical protein